MNKLHERRQHSRYPANHLDVLLKADNTTKENNWALAELVSVDFNQYGIAVESAHQFAVGDQLSLVICTDDGVTTKVNSIICNRSPCDSGFRYGLQFDYSVTQNAQTVRHHLENIEKTVKP